MSYKAVCMKDGQQIAELSAPTMIELAKAVDQWLAEHRIICTWNLFENVER